MRSETRRASAFLQSTVSKRRTILVENKWTQALTQDPMHFSPCSGPAWSGHARPGPALLGMGKWENSPFFSLFFQSLSPAYNSGDFGSNLECGRKMEIKFQNKFN